jgi:hypothetical protein
MTCNFIYLNNHFEKTNATVAYKELTPNKKKSWQQETTRLSVGF